jgi:hypothetical protein
MIINNERPDIVGFFIGVFTGIFLFSLAIMVFGFSSNNILKWIGSLMFILAGVGFIYMGFAQKYRGIDFIRERHMGLISIILLIIAGLLNFILILII